MISIDFRRRNEAPLKFHECIPEASYSIGRDIFGKILKNAADDERTIKLSNILKTDGYVVCDMKMNIVNDENAKDQHEGAVRYFKQIAEETNVIIPIITTPLVMNSLTRRVNLITEEETGEHQYPKTSTMLSESSYGNLSSLDNDISALSVNQPMFLK